MFVSEDREFVNRRHPWFDLKGGVPLATNRLPLYYTHAVRKLRPNPVTRSSFRLGGLSGNTYSFPNQTTANLLAALVTRVYCVKDAEGNLRKCPLPTPGVFDQLWNTVGQHLAFMVGTIAPISYEQFVDCYSGRRRTIYDQAVQSLKLRPLTKGDARIRAFVKVERMLSGKDPRIIQPRHPRYNACVGRWLKPMEKHVFKALNRLWGGITVMKGYNAEETGRHLRDKYVRVSRTWGSCVMVGADASRFDQHVSVAALRFEHLVYLAMARYGHQELASLLEMQLYNEGVGCMKDGFVKYQTSGCRMSGDMNTGLGNCLLMCTMVYQWFLDEGIRGELANNGDDCVFFVPQEDVSKLQRSIESFFLRFGFEMKLETPTTIFEEMEFCQTHVVWNGESWVAVRNFPTCIAKDSNTVLRLDQGECLRAYCGAIADCGMSICGGVPVCQDFYAALDHLSGGVRKNLTEATEWTCGFVMMSRGLHRKFSAPTAEARCSMWKAFGVLPDTQEEMSRSLAQWAVGFDLKHRPKFDTSPEASGACRNLLFF